jgi:ABC-2 type transport system permease protein
MVFSLSRFLALARKEFIQLFRNRRLVVQLVIPPTVALIIFGYALNPEVKQLRVGVADESHTPLSREFIAHLTSNRAFDVIAHYDSSARVAAALHAGELDVAVVIPRNFSELLAKRRAPEAQVIIDAVNANSAGIAQSYLAQASMHFSRIVEASRTPARPPAGVRAAAIPLYNPGLVHAWFFVTGVMSTVIFINASLVSSALTVREKETGTIEQLLMSPVQTLETLFAKTVPVLLLMLVVLLIAMTAGWLVFDLPQRGSWPLLLFSTALAAIGGIGIGILVATFSSTQRQAQLLTFFLLPPLVLLSGAFGTIETMPRVLQWASYVDPLRYMVKLVRGIVLKGAGLELLWPPLAALGVIAFFLYGVSALRFRSQLR